MIKRSHIIYDTFEWATDPKESNDLYKFRIGASIGNVRLSNLVFSGSLVCSGSSNEDDFYITAIKLSVPMSDTIFTLYGGDRPLIQGPSADFKEWLHLPVPLEVPGEQTVDVSFRTRWSGSAYLSLLGYTQTRMRG